MSESSNTGKRDATDAQTKPSRENNTRACFNYVMCVCFQYSRHADGGSAPSALLRGRGRSGRSHGSPGVHPAVLILRLLLRRLQDLRTQHKHSFNINTFTTVNNSEYNLQLLHFSNEICLNCHEDVVKMQRS